MSEAASRQDVSLFVRHSFIASVVGAAAQQDIDYKALAAVSLAHGDHTYTQHVVAQGECHQKVASIVRAVTEGLANKYTGSDIVAYTAACTTRPVVVRRGFVCGRRRFRTRNAPTFAALWAVHNPAATLSQNFYSEVATAVGDIEDYDELCGICTRALAPRCVDEENALIYDALVHLRDHLGHH